MFGSKIYLDCPNCNTTLEPKSRSEYVCHNCHKTFYITQKTTIRMIEIFILVKIADMVSNFLVNKMTFVANKEAIAFVLKLILVCIYGLVVRKNIKTFVKLGVLDLKEASDK